MATKHNCPCFEKAADDEPVFCLRAQDKLASYIVRIWAMTARITGCNPGKIEQAYRDANEMDAWREAHGGGKLPD